MSRLVLPPPPRLPSEECTPGRGHGESLAGTSQGGGSGGVEVRAGKAKLTVPTAVVLALATALAGTSIGSRIPAAGIPTEVRQELQDLRSDQAQTRAELRDFRQEVRSEFRALRSELRDR